VERLVESKQTVQFFSCLPVGKDFFFSPEQEAANALIYVFLGSGGVLYRSTADFIKHFIAQGNHMIPVKDNDLGGKVIQGRPDVCGPHVHGNRFNPGPRPLYLRQEDLQGFRGTVGSDPDHRAGFQVHNDRQVGVTFPYRDFIHSQVFQMPEFPPGILLLERLEMNLFDGVPAHARMPGDVLHRSVVQQVNNVSPQRLGPMLFRVSYLQRFQPE